MRIIYETNGKGFLGWLVDLPGAYIRGSTIEEARSKIDREIMAYESWLGIKEESAEEYTESIQECKLHVEDADTDILFDTELIDFEGLKDFEHWCTLISASGTKADTIYKSCQYKDYVDPHMVRKTFYGNVYSTINGQFAHIIQVQNYYLAQIGTGIEIGNDLVSSRRDFVEKLKEKYLKEGNRLYQNEEEDWTTKKIVRRIIWHDRIHAKAIERIEQRRKAEKNV
jgi:predicted RNase H-like HicB family nuclease